MPSLGIVDKPRVRIGRIRCLTRTVQCMKEGKPLPEPICFVPREIRVEYEGEDELSVFEEPKDGAKVTEKLPGGKAVSFVCTGLPVFNAQGGWLKMTSPRNGWVLLQPIAKSLKGKLTVTGPERKASEKEGKKEPVDWLKVVEQMCTLHVVKPPPLANFNEEEMTVLQTPPPGWSLEADEELAFFLSQHGLNPNTLGTGAQGSEHFTKVEVSSEEDQIPNLLSSNLDDYWESDGNQGQHWIRFHMKPGTIIDKFALLIDSDDGSYIPKRVVVKGGSPGDLSVLQTRNFGVRDYETKELQLFPCPLDSHKEIIEVHVKACYQGGIDTRVRGVSVVTRTVQSLFLKSENLSESMFVPEKVTCYPKLQPFNSKQLFYRSLVLKRLAHLLDQDLCYVLPQWQPSQSGENGSPLSAISVIRQLWPLSLKRNAIIQQLLSDTTSTSPERPVFFINRMAAKEHREEPTKDRECKKTIFCQIIRELQKHTKSSSYNFRWAGHWSQWWECKFIQEGIIDQGGGFRDTLADVAEELCPSDADSVVPLPLFIRSPNQSQDSSNVYRDAYTPNPGCTEKAWYYFVGQLMGAMYRSQESLVLSLPQFVWKYLVGESLTWTRDFVSIDSAEVKLIDSIETMSKDVFDASFAGALDYSTVLSNGDTVPLVGTGDKLVTYEDRLEYCRLVKERRMSESNAQLDAIREGLTSVVPSDVLKLLTWQELELRVCGNPDISIEVLKRTTRYDSGLSENDDRVKMMWSALEKFSNEERSRFLRFVTGRRRLPCTLYVESADHGSKLPTSATCANTVYLPKYDSVEEAVDRLRYAAYNCVAIDTDMSPWE